MPHPQAAAHLHVAGRHLAECHQATRDTHQARGHLAAYGCRQVGRDLVHAALNKPDDLHGTARRSENEASTLSVAIWDGNNDRAVCASAAPSQAGDGKVVV